MGFHPHLQQALHHHVQKESVRCIGGMFLPLIWLAIKWTSLGLRTCLASLAQSSTEECWPGIHPSLRSSSAILLTVSSARLSTVRSRAFSRSAPQLFIFLLSFGIAAWRRVQSQRWPLGHWACPGCCPSPCLTEAEPLRLLLHNHGSQCFPCGHTGLYVEAQVGNDWYMQSLHITGLISHEQREDVKHFEKRYKPAALSASQCWLKTIVLEDIANSAGGKVGSDEQVPLEACGAVPGSGGWQLKSKAPRMGLLLL